MTSACGPRSPHLALLATGGRCWVFLGATPRHGSGRVAAGAAIGDVRRSAADSVRVELWESEHGRHRVANLWNPMLFLDVRQSASPAYPGDHAPRREIAKWMGATAHAAGLPPELPVMAALVQTGLQNLHHRDGDNAGYFQIPVAIWNVGAYAGFPNRPDLQLRWFTDQAKHVRAQRMRQGRDPLAHPECYGAWAADVTRPAEQYRGRFQLRLDEVRLLLGLPLTPTAPPRSCRRAVRAQPGKKAAAGSRAVLRTP